MDENLKILLRLAHFVQATFTWCNLSFSELWYLTQTPQSKEEVDLSKGHTLHFYGIVLQYCIVMEYTKLLEKVYKDENKNVASIIKLNQKLKEHFGDTFQKASINEQIINELTSSDLYKKFKDLRDKKFGHMDGDFIDDALKIRGFTGDEIDECLRELNLILDVINNCAEKLGYQFSEIVPNRDDRTANFIRYHAKYQQYYHDNFGKAHNEGYGLIQC